MPLEEALRENEKLRRENTALRAENVQLRRRLATQEERIRVLEEKVLAGQRASKRQAAPFSKGEPKANPKKPGRKRHHKGAFRPTPEQVDHTVEVPLPAACPNCGGELNEEEVKAQYQVDTPPVKPVTTRFNVPVGHCQDCGRRVQGRDPAQTSDALGQAAVQIGPRALSLAAEAKHVLGVPYAKVAQLLRDCFGLQVDRSTLARADQRIARAYAPMYQLLIRVVRDGRVVWVDETGWKVGGHSAWLWVFTTQAVTVYLIDARRSHEVAERVLGADFAGTLECDCFLAYDALAATQQKCLQHLIRRGDELAEVKAGRAIAFGREVARLLRGAIHLQHRYRDQQLSPHGYTVACGRLEAALDRLIARRVIDPDNVRLARLLQKHRQKLFRFLYEADVTPTNAPAEQAIRPAVAVRKMSACNRQPAGAQTHGILTSMWRTAQQQGADFIAWTMERLRDHDAPPPQWLAELLPLPP